MSEPSSPIPGSTPTSPTKAPPSSKPPAMQAHTDLVGRDAIEKLSKQGIEIASTGDVKIFQTGDGGHIFVREIHTKRERGWTEKASVIIKSAPLLLLTLGTALPQMKEGIQSSWSAEKKVLYDSSLTEADKTAAMQKLVEAHTVNYTKTDKSKAVCDVRKQSETSIYAEQMYSQDKNKFTEIPGQGMFMIQNDNMGQILHVPFTDGQHPDFSKASFNLLRNGKTGEVLKGEALNKAAQSLTIAHPEIEKLQADAMVKSFEHRLTPTALSKQATEWTKKLINLQGPKYALMGIDKRLTEIQRELQIDGADKKALKKERLYLRECVQHVTNRATSINLEVKDLSPKAQTVLSLLSLHETIQALKENTSPLDSYDHWLAQAAVAKSLGMKEMSVTSKDGDKIRCNVSDILNTVESRSSDPDEIAKAQRIFAMTTNIKTGTPGALFRLNTAEVDSLIPDEFQNNYNAIGDQTPEDYLTDTINNSNDNTVIESYSAALRHIAKKERGEIGALTVDYKLAKSLQKPPTKIDEARDKLTKAVDSARSLVDARYSCYITETDNVPKPCQTAHSRSGSNLFDDNRTLITAKDLKKDVQAIQMKIDTIQEKLDEINDDVDATSDTIQKLKGDIANLQEKINNPDYAHEITTHETEIKKLTAQIETIREATIQDDFETQQQQTTYQEQIKPLTQKLNNRKLEVEALTNYETAAAKIKEGGLTPEDLEKAQTKAGQALDKLFYATITSEDGTIAPAGGDNAQLRPQAHQRARMEAALKKRTPNEIFIDPAETFGSPAIRLGHGGVTRNEKLGTWEPSTKYTRSGGGWIGIKTSDALKKRLRAIYSFGKPENKQ